MFRTFNFKTPAHTAHLLENNQMPFVKGRYAGFVLRQGGTSSSIKLQNTDNLTNRAISFLSDYANGVEGLSLSSATRGGIILTEDGVWVFNNQDVTIGLAINSFGVTRKDLVVMGHNYTEVDGGTSPTFYIVLGDNAGNLPALPSNAVAIGEVHVPTGALNSANCTYVTYPIPDVFGDGTIAHKDRYQQYTAKQRYDNLVVKGAAATIVSLGSGNYRVDTDNSKANLFLCTTFISSEAILIREFDFDSIDDLGNDDAKIFRVLFVNQDVILHETDFNNTAISENVYVRKGSMVDFVFLGGAMRVFAAQNQSISVPLTLEIGYEAGTDIFGAELGTGLGRVPKVTLEGSRVYFSGAIKSSSAISIAAFDNIIIANISNTAFRPKNNGVVIQSIMTNAANNVTIPIAIAIYTNGNIALYNTTSTTYTSQIVQFPLDGLSFLIE